MLSVNGLEDRVGRRVVVYDYHSGAEVRCVEFIKGRIEGTACGESAQAIADCLLQISRVTVDLIRSIADTNKHVPLYPVRHLHRCDRCDEIDLLRERVVRRKEERTANRYKNRDP